MNKFDRAHREVFAIMLMEYHRNPHSLVDYEEIQERYQPEATEDLFKTIVGENEHLFLLSRTYKSTSALLRENGYGTVLRETLSAMGADEFDVSWTKEKIYSDVPPPEWFPVPDTKWEWLSGVKPADEPEEGKAETEPNLDRAIRSADWAGISERIGQTELAEIKSKSAELIQAIAQSDLDERPKKNALKHVEAVDRLLEAPDPPWKEIVDLLNNPVLNAFLTATAIIQYILWVVN